MAYWGQARFQTQQGCLLEPNDIQSSHLESLLSFGQHRLLPGVQPAEAGQDHKDPYQYDQDRWVHGHEDTDLQDAFLSVATSSSL